MKKKVYDHHGGTDGSFLTPAAAVQKRQQQQPQQQRRRQRIPRQPRARMRPAQRRLRLRQPREAAGGKLVMATNAEFPPYEYHDGDAIVGIDAEIAKAIADELGMELEIEDIAF